jgi:hypothetical protein
VPQSPVQIGRIQFRQAGPIYRAYRLAGVLHYWNPLVERMIPVHDPCATMTWM